MATTPQLGCILLPQGQILRGPGPDTAENGIIATQPVPSAARIAHNRKKMSSSAIVSSRPAGPAAGSAPAERLVTAVFGELETAGLRYVLPRNWDLPRSVGDIDVLVPSSELAAAAALIRSVAAKHGFASCTHRRDGQGLGV